MSSLSFEASFKLDEEIVPEQSKPTDMKRPQDRYGNTFLPENILKKSLLITLSLLNSVN